MEAVSTLATTTVNIPQMATLKEASEATGLSYRCLKQLCDDHKIPHIRIGVKILINMPKLVEYMNVCGVEDE